MTKKLIVSALLLLFTALMSTSLFGQACSGTPVPQYIAVGSSAQFNSFAFAAEAVLNTAGNGTNFWASSSIPLLDNRVNVSDSSKLWVAWDNSSACNVYAYFSVDSSVGVKDFMAYKKENNSFFTGYDGAGVFVQNTATFGNCAAGKVINAGQPGCAGNGGNLPASIVTFFETAPGPTSKTGAGSIPLPYCGQGNPGAGKGKFCFFNAAHADIRPEDTLFATTRALSTYNGTAGLTGLGYGAVGGSGVGCGAAVAGKEGCAFYSSFGTGGTFFTESFALSGNDPIGGGAVPTFTTLNIGAAPVVVLVSNADTSSAGFGATSGGNYVFNNINHKILANIEDGTLSCTNDVLTTGATGPGKPIQVYQREALSGTYNTFEFTAVRTLSGSAAAAVTQGKVTTATWLSDDESGQELGNNPNTNYNTGTNGCSPGGVTVPTGTCGDPKWHQTGACGSAGNGVQLRVIGTGEMVKSVAGVNTVGGVQQQSNEDALGYAFWSYGNMAPAGSNCTGTNTGNVTCTSQLAHYLTVDGIDPLFENPGDSSNPQGAFNFPQCALKTGSPTCFTLSFPHLQDGSYPFWTILRAMTFNKTGTQIVPPAVVTMIAEAEKSAANNTLGDFVPYFTNINGADTTGDLNLFVFRSHYLQNGSKGPLTNGYSACNGVFTGISLTPAAGQCTVDQGGDVGGTVLTVQSDTDFNDDFGGTAPNPIEIFNLHQ